LTNTEFIARALEMLDSGGTVTFHYKVPGNVDELKKVVLKIDVKI
jgi:hypothetical protein